MLPRANPRVLFQRLPDGAVLLDTASEVYFGLNPVGARVWELLPPASRTLDDLCAALADEYPDAPAAVLRDDVAELLSQLAEHGLVLTGAAVEEDDDARLAATAA